MCAGKQGPAQPIVYESALASPFSVSVPSVIEMAEVPAHMHLEALKEAARHSREWASCFDALEEAYAQFQRKSAEWSRIGCGWKTVTNFSNMRAGLGGTGGGSEDHLERGVTEFEALLRAIPTTLSRLETEMATWEASAITKALRVLAAVRTLEGMPDACALLGCFPYEQEVATGFCESVGVAIRGTDVKTGEGILLAGGILPVAVSHVLSLLCFHSSQPSVQVAGMNALFHVFTTFPEVDVDLGAVVVACQRAALTCDDTEVQRRVWAVVDMCKAQLSPSADLSAASSVRIGGGASGPVPATAIGRADETPRRKK